MFIELMPLLKDRTLLLTIARLGEKVKVNVIPAKAKEGEEQALTTPLSYTGSPEELDAELGKHLASYVDTHVALGSTLAEAKAEMDAAAKAARQKAKASQAPKTDAATAKKAEATTPSTTTEATPSLFSAPAPINREFCIFTWRRKENIMIDAKVLSRSFTYNGLKLPDPDPRMTPEDVKAAYSHQ